MKNYYRYYLRWLLHLPFRQVRGFMLQMRQQAELPYQQQMI
mgnify:FL=1